MGYRLSKITTRTGDSGTTGLGDGARVSKACLRVQAMGDIDELNSFLGLLLCDELPSAVRESLMEVQHDLFDLGGELAIPGTATLGPGHIEQLERRLELFNADLPPLKEFILPGGNRAAAIGHVARSVCRRAERSAVALAGDEPVNPSSLAYLNRLSDLLFVIARVVARQAGGSEVYWNRERGGT